MPEKITPSLSDRGHPSQGGMPRAESGEGGRVSNPVDSRLKTDPALLPDFSSFQRSELDDLFADLRETTRQLDQELVQEGRGIGSTGEWFLADREKAEEGLNDTSDRETAKKERLDSEADIRRMRMQAEGEMGRTVEVAGQFISRMTEQQRSVTANIQILEERIRSREPIQDLSIFDRVTEEDACGFRKVVFQGMWINFIDRQNRILSPFQEGLKSDWFEEAYEFRSRNWRHPFLRKEPLAIVKKRGEGLGFLDQNGRFFLIDLNEDRDNMLVYLSDGDPMALEEDSGEASEYLALFIGRVEYMANQSQQGSEAWKAFGDLAACLRKERAEEGWEAILASVKQKVRGYPLSEFQKALIMLEVRQAADQSGVGEAFAESLYSLDGVGKGKWSKWEEWSKGFVLKTGEGEGTRFVPVVADQDGVRPTGMSFKAMKPMEGGWAPVQTEEGWNLFGVKEGDLMFRDCVEEIEGPSTGFYRIKQRNGRFHFVSTQGVRLEPKGVGKEGAFVGFEKAGLFDPKTRIARVWVDYVEYVLNASGELMPFEEMLKYAQWTKDQLESRRAAPVQSKEERQKALLASLPKMDVDSGKPRLSSALSNFIHDLMRECPEQTKPLIHVFGQCRQWINREVAKEESRPDADPIDSKLLRGQVVTELERLAMASDLPQDLRLRLCRFFYRMDGFRWKAIDPLPVPVRVGFGGLLGSNLDHEAELVKLAHRLESLISRSAVGAREGKLALYPPMEDEVSKAPISPLVRVGVLNEVLEMVNSPHYYWSSGMSMDEFQPKTASGKRVQEMLANPQSKVGPSKEEPANRPVAEVALKTRPYLAKLFYLVLGMAVGATVQGRFEPDWAGMAVEARTQMSKGVDRTFRFALEVRDEIEGRLK